MEELCQDPQEFASCMFVLHAKNSKEKKDTGRVVLLLLIAYICEDRSQVDELFCAQHGPAQVHSNVVRSHGGQISQKASTPYSPSIHSSGRQH